MNNENSPLGMESIIIKNVFYPFEGNTTFPPILPKSSDSLHQEAQSYRSKSSSTFNLGVLLSFASIGCLVGGLAIVSGGIATLAIGVFLLAYYFQKRSKISLENAKNLNLINADNSIQPKPVLIPVTVVTPIPVASINVPTFEMSTKALEEAAKAKEKDESMKGVFEEKRHYFNPTPKKAVPGSRFPPIKKSQKPKLKVIEEASKYTDELTNEEIETMVKQREVDRLAQEKLIAGEVFTSEHVEKFLELSLDKTLKYLKGLNNPSIKNLFAEMSELQRQSFYKNKITDGIKNILISTGISEADDFELPDQLNEVFLGDEIPLDIPSDDDESDDDFENPSAGEFPKWE
jgi:hypothetical protein